MVKKAQKREFFYGTTTIGEKGQAVIPAKARELMNLKKGEKLLVFGIGCDMIVFSKLINLEKFVSHLSSRLDAIRSIIKKARIE